MTHRGPFQPRTFCDSMISTRVPTSPLHLQGFASLCEIGRWPICEPEMKRGEIIFPSAFQHSCVVWSVTPLNHSTPVLAEEMGQIIQGATKVEETQNSYQ